jgi:lauroyl/myristoyl acyltransferase
VVSLAYYLYRLAGVIIPKIPPATGYALCRGLGGILYQFNSRSRANIQLNLQRILGPHYAQAEIERRARATFNYVLYNYFDLFRLPALDETTVKRLVTITGWENVEAALAGERGLVMVSAHLGKVTSSYRSMPCYTAAWLSPFRSNESNRLNCLNICRPCA